MKSDMLYVHETDPIARALELMMTGLVHHLPVLGKDLRIVGMLSDRDLLRGLAGGQRRTAPVALVMSRAVHVVRPSVHAHVAVQRMLDAGISSLAVESEDGSIVGIVTSHDFLPVAEEALRGSGEE